MLNGQATLHNLSQESILKILDRVTKETLNYSEESASQLIQLLIESTSRDFHPIINSIIHRGIQGYYLYRESKVELLKEDIKDILSTLEL